MVKDCCATISAAIDAAIGAAVGSRYLDNYVAKELDPQKHLNPATTYACHQKLDMSVSLISRPLPLLSTYPITGHLVRFKSL